MSAILKNVALFFWVQFIGAHALKFRCDYSYIPAADGWLKIHTEPMSWDEANTICILEGAELASPSNKGLANSMFMLMEDMNIDIVHTGITLLNDRRLVFSKDGVIETVQKSNWYPYICYKQAVESVELNECGTVDNEYILDKRTNNCYKFHRNQTNWYQALLTCFVEGGVLAVINSDEEAQVIRDIFARNPADSIPGYNWRDSAFVGFNYRRRKNQWVTVQGEILEEAGYSKWSPGEPNNANGDEWCGSSGRNGLLFDDPCTREMPFICEKTITSLLCDVHTGEMRGKPTVSEEHRAGLRNKYQKTPEAPIVEATATVSNEIPPIDLEIDFQFVTDEPIINPNSHSNSLEMYDNDD